MPRSTSKGDEQDILIPEIVTYCDHLNAVAGTKDRINDWLARGDGIMCGYFHRGNGGRDNTGEQITWSPEWVYEDWDDARR